MRQWLADARADGADPPVTPHLATVTGPTADKAAMMQLQKRLHPYISVSPQACARDAPGAATYFVSWVGNPPENEMRSVVDEPGRPAQPPDPGQASYRHAELDLG